MNKIKFTTLEKRLNENDFSFKVLNHLVSIRTNPSRIEIDIWNNEKPNTVENCLAFCSTYGIHGFRSGRYFYIDDRCVNFEK